jgi:hypothetical protein
VSPEKAAPAAGSAKEQGVSPKTAAPAADSAKEQELSTETDAPAADSAKTQDATLETVESASTPEPSAVDAAAQTPSKRLERFRSMPRLNINGPKLIDEDTPFFLE